MERRPDYYHITKDRTLVPHHPRNEQTIVELSYPSHVEQRGNTERQPLVEATRDLDPSAEINESPSQTQI